VVSAVTMKSLAGFANPRLAAIIGLSLALKAAVFFLVARYNPEGVWEPDSQAYHQLAVNLLNDGVFSRSSAASFEPEVFRTPGYPLFLAVIYQFVGIHPLRVIPFQIVLSLATIYLAYRIAERLLDEKAGLLAAGFLALDPVSLLYSQKLLTETLFAFHLAVSVFFFLGAMKGNRLFGGSVLGSFFLAMATYTRPASYYLGMMVIPAALLLYWLLTKDWKQAVQAVLAVLLVQAILIGGWQLRNSLQAGSAAFSHIRGEVLLFERAAGIVAITEGVSFEEAKKRLVGLHYESLQPDPGRWTQARLGERWEREGLKIIKEHPFLYLWVAARGGLAVIAGPSSWWKLFGGNGDGFKGAGALSALAYGIGFLVVLYAGIALFARYGRVNYEALFLALIAAYLIVISSGPMAYSRLRMPIMPLLCVLSAAGYVTFLKARADKGVTRIAR
jgi:4-amino-4-deoxy-L-arabinose transferase-like glycosyltransferase